MRASPVPNVVRGSLEHLAFVKFFLGYHWTLLEMQVRNPSALVLAYLDDTYIADAPRPALEAMLEGDELARRWSGVESNVGKRHRTSVLCEGVLL